MDSNDTMLAIDRIAEAEGIPAKRLTELIQAEKERRAAIFPCPVGSTVYFASEEANAKHARPYKVTSLVFPSNKNLNFVSLEPLYGPKMEYAASFRSFGKTVFLSQAEADAHLVGGGNCES